MDERLIHTHEDGTTELVCCLMSYNEAHGCPDDSSIPKHECPGQRAANDKLAAYEDTDLSPAQVAELARAQREGRCVVLPCSVERLKWAVEGIHDAYGCPYGEMRIPAQYGDCRKGCFDCIVDGLRQEAERALSEREGGHERE